MKKIITILLAVVSLLCFVSCKDGNADDGGTVKLNVANLYMQNIDDEYTEYIEDKFNVSLSGKQYSWADWDSQVTSAINGNNMPDVFHWNLDYNTFPTLKRWVKGGSLKALPDLSAYPNIKRCVEACTAVENMKINGKLYGIPLIKNPQDTGLNFNEFTYIYRKDWVKKLVQIDSARYSHLLKDDNVFTYDEFEEMLYAFKENDLAGNNKTVALADVEWSYPSVANYFIDAPYSYVYDDAQNKYVWNYTTQKFTDGLNKAKKYVTDGVYWQDQYSSKEGGALTKFKSGVVGCYFENVILTNYDSIRKEFKANNPTADVDDACSLMHLKRADGKFVYEGGYNWYSVTLFSADTSDVKMKKMLEIMDWLLGEEGTKLATYGLKDVDYTENDDGTINLLWTKKTNGEYAKKKIGAQYLRYTASIGYDIAQNNPLIGDKTKEAYNKWNGDVRKFIEDGDAYVMPLYLDMNWKTSKNKDNYAGLRNEAKSAMVEYTFGKGGWDEFNKQSKEKYESVLSEING